MSFRDPAIVFYYRRVLLCHHRSEVINDRSIFNMAGSLGLWTVMIGC